MRFYLALIICLLLTVVIFAKPSEHGTDELKKTVEDNQTMLEFLEKRLDVLKEEVIRVKVTGYSPTVEECDDDPYITAFNKRVKTGSIAISRDLERDLGWKLGDMVHLHGLGTFEVWDRMPSKWNRRVDIFFFDTDEAKAFGVKHAIAENISLPG